MIKNFIKRLFNYQNNSSNNLLNQKLDEIAFYVNMVKNGMTVLVGENTALTRIFTGQKMYVDTRDISNAPHLMLEGYWEMEVTTLIRKFIKSDTVFIDIGAHMGYFSLIAGTHIETGHIYSIEANPELIHLMEKSRSVNGLDSRMTISNVAIADEKSTLKLSRFESLWGSSTLREVNDKRIDKTYAVSALSLDEYVKENSIERISLIKIDVEGYEEKAYEGMTKVIKENPDLIIFMEYSDAAYNDSESFFTKLSQDFAYVYVIQKSGELSPVSSYSDYKSQTTGDWDMIVLSHKNLR